MLAERVDVLGVGVSPLTMSAAVTTIDTWITERVQHYVCVTGVHGVMESQRDPMLQQIYDRAGMVTPDGMPLVWISRLSGIPNTERVYGPDLMLATIAHGIARGYRHYLYGGAEHVPDVLARRLQQRFPGIQIVGTFSPPFRPVTPEEDEEIVRMINATRPDIVWVGLSTPKQERWMGTHHRRIEAPVMVGVGAAFDFHAGLKTQAPQWMQHNGLEWVFRLLSEPRRLWKRYLINNPLFLVLLAQQLLSRHRS